jgi:carbonic anhydrase
LNATGLFQPQHPTALAVYCSDGRFTAAVEELLASLGHRRLDTLTLPGGPGLFSHWTAHHGEAYTLKQAARFLIESHRTQNVVLVAHHGCGYYRARYPDQGDTENEERARRDLQAAREALREIQPSLQVDVFFARPSEGHVRFERVA